MRTVFWATILSTILGNAAYACQVGEFTNSANSKKEGDAQAYILKFCIVKSNGANTDIRLKQKDGRACGMFGCSKNDDGTWSPNYAPSSKFDDLTAAQLYDFFNAPKQKGDAAFRLKAQKILGEDYKGENGYAKILADMKDVSPKSTTVAFTSDDKSGLGDLSEAYATWIKEKDKQPRGASGNESAPEASPASAE